MAGNRIIKVCTIAGLVLAEVYMGFVMLAPNNPVAATVTKPFVPLETIPKSDLPVGTPPPTSTKVTRLLVGAVFFGPFGAMAGMGIGFLIAGAMPKRKDDPA